jgi:acetyl-CoA C-acetyltransferase
VAVPEVAIVGTGQTKHAQMRADVNIPEMLREAVDRALEDAGVTFAEIDAVCFGNMDLFEGLAQNEHWLASTFGAEGKPLVKFNTGGTVGTSTVIGAYTFAKAGLYGKILACGFQKQAEGNSQGAITTVGDPIWERPMMAGAIGNHAVMASTYAADSGITEEQAAKVAVKARRNACLNPYAHLQMPDITVEDVLNSKMLAYPIRMLDMCPTSNGACAVVMAVDGVAQKLAARPAWIAAVAGAHDQTFQGDSPKRMSEMRSLIAVRKKLYAKMGITDPVKQFDVAELYEPQTYAELAMCENLLFCPPGGGGKFIDDGGPLIDGPMPVNPSGGVLSTNPIGATAMIRVAEAAKQVMGRAGDHQVKPDVQMALATGYGGNAWTDALILTAERPS